MAEPEKTYTQNELDDTINQVVRLVQNNQMGVEGIRSRMAQALSGGYDFADTLHNVYLDYGYPQVLDFFNYWNMYRRFGIAKNVVEKVVGACWKSAPTVEGLGNEWDTLVNDQKLWNRIKGVDTRQRVGRYGGLFIRVRDGKKPSEPIEGKLSGPDSIVSITPLYESQLRVTEVEQDETSNDFGQPKFYQYSASVTGNRDPMTSVSTNIHPDRIIIFAEGSDSDSIYGISALEPGYNSLLDLRKIIGAGGEGFYRNACQSVVFDVKDSTSAAGNKDLLEKFNEQFDDFTHNRMRRGFWTPGLEAKALDSTLANPKDYFLSALNDVAASVPIPATVLIGQQTGRLASDEDMQTFLSDMQSRRENWLTEAVSDVVDWCMKWGVIANANEYEVVWDDLLAADDSAKLGNAERMASVNEKQFRSGGQSVFTEEEMREAAGMDNPEELPPEDDDDTDGVPDETLPDDLDIDDDGAQPEE